MRFPTALHLLPLRLAAALPAAALLATTAAAQTLLLGDYSIDGKLCVGLECTASETFGSEGIKIKQDNPRLVFEDSSTIGSSNDWALVANAIGLGTDSFLAIKDVETGQQAFKVEGGASENALMVNQYGRVGIGTGLPQSTLHIVSAGPSFQLEQTGAGGALPTSWKTVIASNGELRLFNGTGSDERMVFSATTGATVQALTSDGDGNLILSEDPAYNFTHRAPLHMRRLDGNAKILVEEASTTTSPRTLLQLENNGRPEIVMANTDTGGEWSFGAGTKFILKQGAIGSASSAKTKLFEIDDSGNATLTGSLTTGGTTCGTGCDAVFDPDYALPSIEEHAREMRALGYLPNVGPTPEGQPIDLTDKLGRMLNELEHAHLYIAQQQAELAALKADHAARIAALSARLAQLETH